MRNGGYNSRVRGVVEELEQRILQQTSDLVIAEEKNRVIRGALFGLYGCGTLTSPTMGSKDMATDGWVMVCDTGSVRIRPFRLVISSTNVPSRVPIENRVIKCLAVIFCSPVLLFLFRGMVKLSTTYPMKIPVDLIKIDFVAEG